MHTKEVEIHKDISNNCQQPDWLVAGIAAPIHADVSSQTKKSAEGDTEGIGETDPPYEVMFETLPALRRFHFQILHWYKIPEQWKN